MPPPPPSHTHTHTHTTHTTHTHTTHIHTYGIGSSVILSDSLSSNEHAGKQTNARHAHKRSLWKNNVDGGICETTGEERSTTVVLKRDFTDQTFWRLQKTGFNKIYWQKIVHWSSRSFFCFLSLNKTFYYFMTSKDISLEEVRIYIIPVLFALKKNWRSSFSRSLSHLYINRKLQRNIKHKFSFTSFILSRDHPIDIN